MDEHITQHRQGFPHGRTRVTKAGEESADTGISFDIIRLQKGDSLEEVTTQEVALLLLNGAIELNIEGNLHTPSRGSLFDEGPFCSHMSVGTEWSLEALTGVEIAYFSTENRKSFPPEVYTAHDVSNEERGKGQVGGACLRWVRTIFDDSNAHPNSQLVLGEVVNMPGKWSSYPPHHHPQPEIYHYRFTHPRGYGHGELGDAVLKIRSYDTVKILDNHDHAQCSAPGYGMYYIWVIRHLPNARYSVPEFTQEHSWTMDSKAHFWSPEEVGV